MAQWKLAEGGALHASDKLVTDPHLEDPNQLGTGGKDRSVYLSVGRRDSGFGPKAYYPLYKVDVAAGSSSPQELPRIGKLKTGPGKTFIPLPYGSIISIGGQTGDTIIFDFKTPTSEPRVIRGPNLLAAKWCPVVAAVGLKVYALSTTPSYKTEPDFPPWFEVLDLSKATVAAKSDGSLSLDGCFWEELSCPPFFPRKLSPRGYNRPPIITVRSYVAVPPYILISLNENTSGTYAFDTISGEWHMIHDKFLPFLGPATPHGHSGCVFLGSCLEDGSINAYHIRISTSSCSSAVSCKGSALQLSLTVLPMKHKVHDKVGTMADQYITSLDSGHFCLLSFSFDQLRLSCYSETIIGTYSRKLLAKLTTYEIENPALLEETQDPEELPEIAISTLWEQDFKFSSSYGFFSPPISFALSMTMEQTGDGGRGAWSWMYGSKLDRDAQVAEEKREDAKGLVLAEQTGGRWKAGRVGKRVRKELSTAKTDLGTGTGPTFSSSKFKCCEV